MATINILFVCSGNTCRSPIAEALLKDKIKKMGLEKKVKCDSRGLFVDAFEKINENAKLALAELGVSIKNRSAKQFELSCLKSNKVILTMTKDIKDKICNVCSNAFNVYTLSEYISGEDIPDPFGKPLEAYLEMARYLDFLMERLLDKLVKEFRL